MKVVMWIVGIVVVLVVGVGAYLVLNSGNLIKTAVETLGPDYLGVPVKLDAAEISLIEGSGELRGLVIGNPGGFDGPHAMSIDRIAVTLDPTQLSDTLVVIKSLVVDGADVAIVAKGKDTNFQAIKDTLDSADAAESAAEESSADMKMIIDSFVFTNAKTSLDSDLIGQKTVSIPDIKLAGVGRKSSGVSAREALKQLFAPIVKSSSEALVREGLGVEDLKKDLNEKAQQGISSGMDSLRKRLQKTEPES